MAHRVCPWWLGYVLASPLRRLVQSPHAILEPYVAEGMTVVEPGPGMGFFTLELARLVGPKGRVIAIDLQPKMLAGLMRRARRAQVAERIEARQPEGEHLGIGDLRGAVDFALAFAMVHETPSAEALFDDLHLALKPGAKLLLAEPTGHVAADAFAKILAAAGAAGFKVQSQPVIRRSRTALLLWA